MSALPLLIAATLLSWGAPVTEVDIVVTARRLEAWRGLVIIEQGGVLRCRIVKSTGDDALDAKGCAAMTQCFGETRPQFAAAQVGALAARARKRLLATAQQSLAACFEEAKRRIAIEATQPSLAQPSPDAAGPN